MLLHGCGLEFCSPDMAKTNPGAFSLVEFRARLQVTNALSDMTVPGIISLVEDENRGLKEIKFGAITDLSLVRREPI